MRSKADLDQLVQDIGNRTATAEASSNKRILAAQRSSAVDTELKAQSDEAVAKSLDALHRQRD